MANHQHVSHEDDTVSPIYSSPPHTNELENLWTTNLSSLENILGENLDLVEDPTDRDVDFLHQGLNRVGWVLNQGITPCRLHTLTVVSRLIFTGLTTGILLKPGSLIPESESLTLRSSLSFGETVWLIFSIGNLIELLFPLPKHARSRSLLLPTLSLLLVPFAGFRIYAYPLLTFSLPFLFFSLFTPSSPSFVHVFPDTYLPFTTFAFSVIQRSFGPMILLAPLGLLVFIALAIGLNGDLWRIGLSFVLFRISEPSSITRSEMEISVEGLKLTPTPAEPGIAPFAVRLWLSITLIAVLWLMIVVGCARGMTTGRLSHQSYSSLSPFAPNGDGYSQGQEGCEDQWIEEWGRGTGQAARKIRERTIQAWLPSPRSGSSPLPESRLSFEEDARTVPSGEAQRQGALIVRFPSPLNIFPLILYGVPSFFLSVIRYLDSSQHTRMQQVLDRWGQSSQTVLAMLLGGLTFGWWDGAKYVWNRMKRGTTERARGEIRLGED